MKTHIYLFLTLFFGLTSCSPRIGQMVMKSYPALSSEEPVIVYTNDKFLPKDAETIGKIKVSDSGFTVQCDSITVIELVKDESRKMGGNAVFVTEHIKPSFWGSSCHQMAANSLRVNESSFIMGDDSISHFTNEKNIKPERKLSKFAFYIGGGYGWRTAKMNPDFNDFQRSYYKKLASGPVWDASFSYYFNDIYGLGLIYSAYSASNSEYAVENNSYGGGKEGYLDTKDLISYVGPVFSMRVSSDPEWLFYLSISIGYIEYNSKITFPSLNLKAFGSSVGFQTNLGAEYKLSNDWGICMNLSSLSGILDKMNYEKNGVKSSKTLEKSEGLQHLRLLMGLRYHIK